MGVEVSFGPLLGGGLRSTFSGSLDRWLRLSESVDEMSLSMESLLPPSTLEGGRGDCSMGTGSSS